MMKILLLVLFCSTISYSQWIQQNSTTSLSLNSVDFINEQTGWVVGAGGVILKTTNGGALWTQQNSTTSIELTGVSFVDNNTGFVCGYQYINFNIQFNLVLKTTNSGVLWDTSSFSVAYSFYRTNTSLTFFNSLTGILTRSGSNGFVGHGEALRTVDGGVTWHNIPLGTGSPIAFTKTVNSNSNTGYILGMYFDDTQQDTNRVFKTTDAGNAWNEVFRSSGVMYRDISVNNNMVVISGIYKFGMQRGNIMKSTNSGLNWQTATPDSVPSINCSYFINNQTGWCGVSSGRIFYTTNGGSNWLLQFQGVPTLFNEFQLFPSCTGYLVGTSGRIHKTTNCGITALNNISTSMPENFSLSQNYPNPFNPVTKIKFQIPKSPLSFGEGLGVGLKIYNSLGHEVKVLVNQSLQPGTYEVDWDASNYPSGVYFYELTSGDFTQTKKMVLLK